MRVGAKSDNCLGIRSQKGSAVTEVVSAVTEVVSAVIEVVSAVTEVVTTEKIHSINHETIKADLLTCM